MTAGAEIKHTPGPWTAVESDRSSSWRFSIKAANDMLIGCIDGSRFIFGSAHCDEGAGNARLISAAPELLAILQRALAAVAAGELYEDTNGRLRFEDASIERAAEDTIAMATAA